MGHGKWDMEMGHGNGTWYRAIQDYACFSSVVFCATPHYPFHVPCPMSHFPSRECPALAVVALQELIRADRVRHAHRCAVVVDLRVGAERHNPEEHDFGE